MFSLSLSPPQPSNFFTTTTRSRFHVHAPQTPSPLRTSRNANLNLNFMPRPNADASTGSGDRDDQSCGSLLSSSPLAETYGAFERGSFHNAYADENENKNGHGRDGDMGAAGFQKTPTTTTTTTPQGKAKSGPEGNGNFNLAGFITPPDSASASNGQFQSNMFHFQPQSSNNRQSPSQWEHRSRNASPAATLARHAAQGREKKKTQFLDRVRRRRDDSRSEGYGDQVLRMDFVRERRQWEDEMNRRAMLEAGVTWTPEEDDVTAGVDADMHDKSAAMAMATAEYDHAEMSPTEDHDVDDALVDYYADSVLDLHPKKDSRMSEEDDFLIDDEEEEYDRLFREMIAQNQDQVLAQETQHQRQIQQQHQVDSGQGAQESRSREQNESSMDLS